MRFRLISCSLLFLLVLPSSGNAVCNPKQTLTAVFTEPSLQASAQVNSEVLSVANRLRAGAGKLSAVPFEKLSAQEYAQGFLQWMREVGSEALTARDEITHILQNTQVEELQRLEKIARERQFFRYERLKSEGLKLRTNGGSEEIARAERIQKVLTRDGVALGNGPHVEEVIQHIDSHRAALTVLLKKIHPYTDAELNHYFQYLKTLASVHDLGKTFPDAWVKKGAEKGVADGGNLFVTERIAFHEFSSAVYLKGLENQFHFKAPMMNSLIRSILGHNDGSGLKNVFWNRIAFPESLLGRYPVPDTLSSQILALADRGGQGTLGVSGGVFKVTKQEMARKPFGKALLNETMNLSPTNTILQIKAIAKNMGNGMEENAMTLDLIRAQQNALNAYGQIQWNPDLKSGKIAGHSFADAEEFFSFVNQKDAAITAGQASSDFWRASGKSHGRSR